MSTSRRHRDHANSNDRNVRIRFNESLFPLSRLDSAAIDNHTIERNLDTPEVTKSRSRAYSISQNAELQDALTEPGREPGVDVNELDLDIDHECMITVTDYSKTKYVIHGPFTNAQFISFIDEPQPAWSKIRWVNVNGMSFDVMKKLSNTYHLHKLSVEDCLHFPTRTKIDHYAEHSYVCLALLLLIEEELSDDGLNDISVWSRLRKWFGPDRPRSSAVTHLYRSSDFQTTLREYHFPKSTHNRSVLQYGETSSEVGIEQVSLFYTDSVVISMFEHSGEIIARPILKRIAAGSAMLLRSTEDIDLLIHAIVDGIVDNCEAVISSYQEHLSSLERGVLDNPKREHTRELHLFISDLSLLRKTLAPVITIVNDFRNNLQNAVVAKAQHPGVTPGTALLDDKPDYFATSSNAAPRSAGYWADVADHIYANADNIDSMRALSDNLINLIFNTLSSRQNDIMQYLTITTVVFLPLSTMAGYFGMNFEDFGALHQSAFYFWKIAIPITCVILLLASTPRMMQYLSRLRNAPPVGPPQRKKVPKRWKLRRKRSVRGKRADSDLDSAKEQPIENEEV